MKIMKFVLNNDNYEKEGNPLFFLDRTKQIFYNYYGGIMEKQILHIDVNNAFLSWTAIDRLKKGEEID